MAWAPGIPAAPGVYTVTARSTVGAATTQSTVGAHAWLDQPLGVTANDSAQGSAHAAWQPVAGASAYLAGVGLRGSSDLRAFGDSNLYLWRLAQDGALVPTQVLYLASGVEAIAAGFGHACALRDGKLWCWGDNGSGQTGIRDYLRTLSPIEVDPSFL